MGKIKSVARGTPGTGTKPALFAAHAVWHCVVSHAVDFRRGTKAVMFKALGQVAGRLLRDFRESLARQRREETARQVLTSQTANFQPLTRVIVTDGVGRT